MNDHPIPQDHPIRLLPNTSDHPSNIRVFPITGSSRRIKVAGKVFTVTPETCYKHITADGSDYYPYFDFTLPTADDNDDSIDFEQWLESMFERGVPE